MGMDIKMAFETGALNPFWINGIAVTSDEDPWADKNYITGYAKASYQYTSLSFVSM